MRVTAGLDPAVHAVPLASPVSPHPCRSRTSAWIRGSSPRMTSQMVRHFFLDTCLYYSYITILAPVKDMTRRHTVSWERGRCPRAGLQPAPGRLGYHVSRHYDRGGRCFPGLGQAKAGNALSDRVPGSLA